MKIYFTSSITGLEQYRDTCQRVSDFLKQEGHIVTDNFLRISKEEDIKWTQEHSEEVYGYIIKQITQADVFICELSYRSAPVSYQLSYALEHEKPTLYLYEEKSGQKPHAVFLGNKSRYLTVKAYTEKNIEQILTDFLLASKRLMLRRFNFFIPAELDEFLGVNAALNRISKGEYVRKLIQEKMNTNKKKR